MITQRTSGVRHLVLLAQCGLITAGFWLWFLLIHCDSLPIQKDTLARYAVCNELILLGLVVLHLRTPAGNRLNNPSFEMSSRQTLRQVASTLFYLLIFLVAARDDVISRSFLFSCVPLLYILLFVTNRRLPQILGHFNFGKSDVQQVVLVGSYAKGLEFRAWLDRNPYLGFEIQGLLTDDTAPAAPNPDTLQILGRLADLPKLLSGPGSTTVIAVEFPRGTDSMRELTRVCEENGARLVVLADLDQIFGHPLLIFQEQGRVFLGLREEPLEDPINRFIKRSIDIVVSGLVVMFILPACALFVWLCQRWQSPGPLFYRQLRPGFHNRPFKILKFRSLHVDNPDMNRLPTPGDPRVYPAGRWIRKVSIDELPQFWNVLGGEMSVVGPRPHLMADNDRFIRLYNKAYIRSFVKPGITGLAQVRGFRGQAGDSEEIAQRIGADIEYLERWTPWLDCWLILRTALQMVFPTRNAI